MLSKPKMGIILIFALLATASIAMASSGLLYSNASHTTVLAQDWLYSNTSNTTIIGNNTGWLLTLDPLPQYSTQGDDIYLSGRLTYNGNGDNLDQITVWLEVNTAMTNITSTTYGGFYSFFYPAIAVNGTVLTFRTAVNMTTLPHQGS